MARYKIVVRDKAPRIGNETISECTIEDFEDGNKWEESEIDSLLLDHVLENMISWDYVLIEEPAE